MTDQEFDKELSGLLSEGPTQKKKKGRIRFWKKWSRKRKIITAVAAVAAVLVGFSFLKGGDGPTGLPVTTASLTKGDVQEMLSISGPVSGTDSAEVVSRIHAEILEILVKEGDRVEADQVLARLDPADVEKEVEIAQNAYNLAVSERTEAQTQAETGYAKAVSDRDAAQREYDRLTALFSTGDVPRVDLETAGDKLEEAKRQILNFTVVDGKPKANDSYDYKIRNAEFELEQKKKQLEETEVTSPIAGTVVRVNSRVGRFADTVDDDKPLFAIDNLDNLEMKINVSEYSIGKVKVGQNAEISADILGDGTEQGVITSISPTGEEKGGGSSERVIPTTIRIENPDTKLIAGITARAKIVLNEAKDAWVVPVSAVIERDDGKFLASVEDNAVKLIPVETGVESDVSMEVKGEGLTEGLSYITTADATLQDGTPVLATPKADTAAAPQ